MTERLYYTDPCVTEFDALVVRIETSGGRRCAVLDRTAFYPTSGGQPFDTGMLGGARVVDVVDSTDGGDDVILHVLDGELATGPAHGTVDWGRRFDHMQQHTGQHVLSAAFDRLLGARTESFHLGSASATIDLARLLTPDEIAIAETEANRIVWEDRPVTVGFVDADDAAKLPLRKQSSRAGVLRLVDVEDFDVSACGGTHVLRTGAIGIIAIASWEKVRGGTRVEFLCGTRALQGYRALRDSMASSVRLLSVLPADLPAGIDRLQSDAKDARRQIKDLQARLAGFEAAALADCAEPFGGGRAVVAALEGMDASALKTIAAAISGRSGHVALLISTPAPSSVVISRAADATFDCAAALRRLTERFSGKGGGRAEAAQGGGLQGDPAEILAFAKSLL